MPLRRGSKTRSLSIISLFTCGMGLDIGFERAGFSTRYTNDITKFACDTIRANKPHVPCDEGDITDITSADILKKASLGKGDVDVVIGGPPCSRSLLPEREGGLTTSAGLRCYSTFG